MPVYAIKTIAGLKSSERRAVLLLSAQDDGEVDAVQTFGELVSKRERELRSRFETWIDGVEHNNGWFHGFTEDAYRDCFVFKWKEKRIYHRLYGFLYHPLLTTNRRFQICVLTNHATKTTWETDPTELAKAKSLCGNQYVQATIAMFFAEYGGGKKSCH